MQSMPLWRAIGELKGATYDMVSTWHDEDLTWSWLRSWMDNAINATWRAIGEFGRATWFQQTIYLGFFFYSIKLLQIKNWERAFWEDKTNLSKTRRLDSKKNPLLIQSPSDLGTHFPWQLKLPLATGIHMQNEQPELEANWQNCEDYAAMISQKKKRKEKEK